MKSPLDTAFRVAFVYAAVAAAWILISDAVLATGSTDWFELVSVLKGLAFVVVTSVVLFWLVARYARGLADEAYRAESSERVLAQVVGTVPVGVVLTSADGEVTYLNPTAERLLDLSADRAIGLLFADLCVGDAATRQGAVDELMRTGTFDGLMLAPRGSDGTRAVVARAAAVEPGAPQSGWVFALADVTGAQADVRQAEACTQAYRFLAESLFECDRATQDAQLLTRIAALAVESGAFMAAWACVRSASTGRLESVAHDGLGSAGVDVGMLLLRRLNQGDDDPAAMEILAGRVRAHNDLAHDPSTPWYAAASVEQLASCATVGVSDSDGLHAMLVLFAGRAGYFESMRLEVLERLSDALSFTMERLAFNERRLIAEEELEESEEGYRFLFEKHPVPLWIYDTESLAFLAVNDAAVAKYGYSEDEFSAMSIADIRPSEDVPRLISNVTHLTEGFEDSGVWTHIDARGREFPVHIYSHTLVWEERPAEMVMALEVATVE